MTRDKNAFCPCPRLNETPGTDRQKHVFVKNELTPDKTRDKDKNMLLSRDKTLDKNPGQKHYLKVRLCLSRVRYTPSWMGTPQGREASPLRSVPFHHMT